MINWRLFVEMVAMTELGLSENKPNEKPMVFECIKNAFGTGIYHY